MVQYGCVFQETALSAIEKESQTPCRSKDTKEGEKREEEEAKKIEDIEIQIGKENGGGVGK